VSAGPGAAFQTLIKMVGEDRCCNHPTSHYYCRCRVYLSIDTNIGMPTYLLYVHV
jgi:hypothetical protein